MWTRIRAAASVLAGDSTLSQPQPWMTTLFGGDRSVTGRVVTPETTMKVSAAYACVRVLAQTMGSLPLTLYRRTDDTVVPATDHPLYDLVKWQPNPEMTSQDLRELLVVDLCLRGTSFRQVVRGGGRVTEIVPLPFDRTTMRRDNGGLIYDFQPVNGERQTFTAGQVWRVPGLSFNGLQGLTPISYARESLGLALAMEEQAGRLFSNGMQVPGYVKLKGVARPEVLEAMQERLSRRFAGLENAYKMPILQEDAEIVPIGLSAQDTEFLAARTNQIAEIARYYGVPLHLVSELSRSTNNNIEHQGIEFVQYTLLPLGTRIEQSMSRDLLLPSERKAGYYFKHNYSGLMRGDTVARFTAYRSAVGGPWMTPDEARAMEEMNAIANGDKLYPPSNMGGDAKVSTEGNA